MTNENTKLTEGIIQERLIKAYRNDCHLMISNLYIYNWESDVFKQLKSGYTEEIEIKISIADFKADKNKLEKHKRIETGITWSYSKREDVETFCRPNRFYYAVPEFMVEKVEIPEYAGLIRVFEDLRRHPSVIKKAPLLHKDKLKIGYEHLARKLAYRLCQATFDRNDAIEAREKAVKRYYDSLIAKS